MNKVVLSRDDDCSFTAKLCDSDRSFHDLNSCKLLQTSKKEQQYFIVAALNPKIKQKK